MSNSRWNPLKKGFFKAVRFVGALGKLLATLGTAALSGISFISWVDEEDPLDVFVSPSGIATIGIAITASFIHNYYSRYYLMMNNESKKRPAPQVKMDTPAKQVINSIVWTNDMIYMLFSGLAGFGSAIYITEFFCNACNKIFDANINATPDSGAKLGGILTFQIWLCFANMGSYFFTMHFRVHDDYLQTLLLGLWKKFRNLSWFVGGVNIIIGSASAFRSNDILAEGISKMDLQPLHPDASLSGAGKVTFSTIGTVATVVIYTLSNIPSTETTLTSNTRQDFSFAKDTVPECFDYRFYIAHGAIVVDSTFMSLAGAAGIATPIAWLVNFFTKVEKNNPWIMGFSIAISGIFCTWINYANATQALRQAIKLRHELKVGTHSQQIGYGALSDTPKDKEDIRLSLLAAEGSDSPRTYSDNVKQTFFGNSLTKQPEAPIEVQEEVARVSNGQPERASLVA